VSGYRVTSPFVCQCLLFLCFLVLLLGSVRSARAAEADSTRSIRDVVRAVEPAIVWVLAKKDDVTYTQGTGFILQENGYILTNAHVINDSKQVTVGWPDRFDRKELQAEVVASDADLDLALLHVNASHLPTVPIDLAASPWVGDSVIALGYPAGEQLGLDNLTVTRGLISSFRSSSESGEKLYQTDASVTLGCSGGPLFDLDTGSVIGIIQGKGVKILEGFNFAIPIERFFTFAGTTTDDGLDNAVSTLSGMPVCDETEPSVRSLESYNMGIEARDKSSWAEALSHFLGAARLENEDPMAAYGVAESYAALDQPRQSLRWLERAFELGYSDFDDALDGQGFEDVKSDERFVNLVQTF
jgi:S1-C subfamily serine protease